MRRAIVLACMLALLGACAIEPDAAPRDVPEAQRGQFNVLPTGGAAAGSSRIFLVTAATEDAPQRLRSVLRNEPDDPLSILESLLAGPNRGEQEDQLSTFLPDDLEILDVQPRGRILTIDVNDAFGELSNEALRFAVAQIVWTASDIENVQRIRLRIDGQNQSWPVGDGENTDRLLSIYDFPGFVETSQPALPALPAAVN